MTIINPVYTYVKYIRIYVYVIIYNFTFAESIKKVQKVT